MIKEKKELDRIISVPYELLVKRLDRCVAYANETTGALSVLSVSSVLFKQDLPISLLRMDIKMMNNVQVGSFGFDKFGVIKVVMDKLFSIRDNCRENAFKALIEKRIELDVYTKIMSENDDAVNGLPIPITP